MANPGLNVHICIPHFFKPSEEKIGYGSARRTNRLARAIALGRCLSSLIAMQRGQEDSLLNIGQRQIDHIPRPSPKESQPPVAPLNIQITVCTDGKHYLNEVLDIYHHRITHKTFDLDNPKDLPLATRDHLIKEDTESGNKNTFDLFTYMEDDLVIVDSKYFDKLNWFLRKTEGTCCLMPHRIEPVFQRNLGYLMVDGDLAETFIGKFTKPESNVAQGKYLGKYDVSFDIATNPHAGTFTINSQQHKLLQGKTLPRNGFISQLETAATLTVLEHFQILKPSLNDREFLMIEHGHPSFTHHLNRLPHRPMGCRSTHKARD